MMNRTYEVLEAESSVESRLIRIYVNVFCDKFTFLNSITDETQNEPFFEFALVELRIQP